MNTAKELKKYAIRLLKDYIETLKHDLIETESDLRRLENLEVSNINDVMVIQTCLGICCPKDYGLPVDEETNRICEMGQHCTKCFEHSLKLAKEEE